MADPTWSVASDVVPIPGISFAIVGHLPALAVKLRPRGSRQWWWPGICDLPTQSWQKTAPLDGLLRGAPEDSCPFVFWFCPQIIVSVSSMGLVCVCSILCVTLGKEDGGVFPTLCVISR